MTNIKYFGLVAVVLLFVSLTSALSCSWTQVGLDVASPTNAAVLVCSAQRCAIAYPKATGDYCYDTFEVSGLGDDTHIGFLQIKDSSTGSASDGLKIDEMYGFCRDEFQWATHKKFAMYFSASGCSGINGNALIGTFSYGCSWYDNLWLDKSGHGSFHKYDLLFFCSEIDCKTNFVTVSDCDGKARDGPNLGTVKVKVADVQNAGTTATLFVSHHGFTCTMSPTTRNLWYSCKLKFEPNYEFLPYTDERYVFGFTHPKADGLKIDKIEIDGVKHDYFDRSSCNSGNWGGIQANGKYDTFWVAASGHSDTVEVAFDVSSSKLSCSYTTIATPKYINH